MDKSGWTTLLMLVMTALIVLLVVSSTMGGLPELWSKLTGQAPPAQEAPASTAPAPDVMTLKPMTTTDGMRQVEQTRRDLEVLDSLAKSVHR